VPQLTFAQVPVQLPPRPPAASLESSLTQNVWLWVRTEYGDDSVVESSNPNAYTLRFGEDRVAIRADCNTGSAGYVVNGSSISFQPGPITLVACGPDSQDSLFLRDLMQAATFVFAGDHLVLNLRFDSGNMIFSPQSPSALSGQPWRVTGINNGMQGVESTVSGTQVTAHFGEDGRVTRRHRLQHVQRAVHHQWHIDQLWPDRDNAARVSLRRGQPSGDAFPGGAQRLDLVRTGRRPADAARRLGRDTTLPGAADDRSTARAITRRACQPFGRRTG